MSRQIIPHFADPLGIVARDINRKATEIQVALGTDDPNTNTSYDVANGGAFGIGCILKNTTGRRLNAVWIYRPLETATGADMGSGNRWYNIATILITAGVGLAGMMQGFVA